MLLHSLTIQSHSGTVKLEIKPTGFMHRCRPRYMQSQIVYMGISAQRISIIVGCDRMLWASS